MSSRCQAVRYCSRECQRTDWKAHKPACTAQTNVSADCVVHAVVQEASLTSSNTENIDGQSNTPLSVYDSKPDAPPEDHTQIMAAPHMNVTLASKKWIFIGMVALIVLVAAGIVCFLLRILAVVEQPMIISTSNHGLVLDSPPCRCIAPSGVP